MFRRKSLVIWAWRCPAREVSEQAHWGADASPHQGELARDLTTCQEPSCVHLHQLSRPPAPVPTICPSAPETLVVHIRCARQALQREALSEERV